MSEIKDCNDYEVAKKLIREYSEIKGAESLGFADSTECMVLTREKKGL